MKKPSRTFILSSIGCLLPLIPSFFLYSQLPEQLVTSWGLDGQPTQTSSKLFALVGFPLFMLMINIVLHFSLQADPKGKNASEKIKSMSHWMAPIMSLFLSSTIIAAAKGLPFNPSHYTPLFIGLMFIFIGNYLPKSRQSYTVGIKTPWALHSEENWDKTHRLAGPIWVAAGFISILSTFLPYGEALMFICLMISAAVPFIYSYVLYIKESDSNKN